MAGLIAAETGIQRSIEDIASGFLKIAVANMANAIKKISVQRGYDLTDYAFNALAGLVDSMPVLLLMFLA